MMDKRFRKSSYCTIFTDCLLIVHVYLHKCVRSNHINVLCLPYTCLTHMCIALRLNRPNPLFNLTECHSQSLDLIMTKRKKLSGGRSSVKEALELPAQELFFML